MIKVHIGDKIEWKDSRDEFSEMQYWAQEHCKSFIAMVLTDVSDVSLYYDTVAEFRFNNEQDATIFTLRWV